MVPEAAARTRTPLLAADGLFGGLGGQSRLLVVAGKSIPRMMLCPFRCRRGEPVSFHHHLACLGVQTARPRTPRWPHTIASWRSLTDPLTRRASSAISETVVLKCTCLDTDMEDSDIHPWDILINGERWSGKVRLIGFVDSFFLICYSGQSRFEHGLMIYSSSPRTPEPSCPSM